MTEILYNIIIFPLLQVIELFFLFIFRVFKSPGIALCGLSLFITILTFPLYKKAEAWQKTERDIQAKMALKIKKIKQVFKGDARYMILTAYYRQNHYHPIYALRSTFGLLIQIPFFIAAWSFISGLELLKDYSFLGIADLGSPDRMIQIGAIRINILPLIMTLINVFSSVVYTKGLQVKEKFQLFSMSAIFLILLYNSPAGLVLYWSFNNLFSLFKNIITKFSIRIRKLYFILLPFAAMTGIYLIFVHPGSLMKRLLLFFTILFLITIPLFKEKIKILFSTIYKILFLTSQFQSRFLISISIIFILSGIVIPSALILSSPVEFSFIEPYKTPFPFLMNVSIQALGLFVFWPLCLYFFFSNTVKHCFSFFFSLFFILFCVNTFLVSENFGFLTNTLVFSDPKPITYNLHPIIINIFIILLFSVIFIFLYKFQLFRSIQVISIIALILIGVINIYRIQTEVNFLINKPETFHNNKNYNEIKPFFHFSKEGKNVLFIMLDSGMPCFLQEIFKEKPEIETSFSGFTWYSNCISFGSHTFIGAPPLYGGYEYTPIEINKRSTVTLEEKHKEASLVLPRLFLDSSWSVTISDSPFNKYLHPYKNFYGEYPQIKIDELAGKYTINWFQSYPETLIINLSDYLKKYLIRFSFFKISPLLFRNFIYDNTRWLSTNYLDNSVYNLSLSDINEYSKLYYLPELTKINFDNKNNFIQSCSQLTHYRFFLQAPDYIPVYKSTNKGNSKFSEDARYHANISAFLLLKKYFDFLDENDVYDNTRIIIVSDHGYDTSSNPINWDNNILLPNKEYLQGYNTLLLFKDFNERGKLNINNDFMTNADAPLLAIKDIIDRPINPFTNNLLLPDKNNGVIITTREHLGAKKSHGMYQYGINSKEWLYVKDNIFLLKNWSDKPPND